MVKDRFCDIPKNGQTQWFPICSFQVVDAWQILKKNWQILKSLYGFGGRCHKIIEVCMDL